MRIFEFASPGPENRLRVVEIEGEFWISIDGRSLEGPFETAEDAQIYGEGVKS